MRGHAHSNFTPFGTYMTGMRRESATICLVSCFYSVLACGAFFAMFVCAAGGGNG